MKKPLTQYLQILLIFSALGTAISVLGQTTVYEQSRSGNSTSGTDNPDFTYVGLNSTNSSTKSQASGVGTSTGSTSSRFASVTPSSFTVSPNNTTAGQLAIGQNYRSEEHTSELQSP